MSGFKSKKIIFILGGPGSGKGTQSNLIKKKYDIGYTVAGDLLRIEAKKGTELGNQITEIMKSGQVASQEVAIRLLKKAILLLKEDIVRQEKEITLIDGFPRSVEQGIAFEKDVVKGRALIFLDVPDDILFERLMKRSENSGRIDDNPETIKKEFNSFILLLNLFMNVSNLMEEVIWSMVIEHLMLYLRKFLKYLTKSLNKFNSSFKHLFVFLCWRFFLFVMNILTRNVA
jgi:adenylate kinase family enzyme